MPKIEKEESGGWRIVSEDGEELFSGLSNAQAWRRLDVMQNEATSASQVSRDFSEPREAVSANEMQDFFSGLIQIAADRGYKDGWPYHQFIAKFGCRPDGLHKIPCHPSKQVWGWVNRKAIAKGRER